MSQNFTEHISSFITRERFVITKIGRTSITHNSF